MKFVNSWSGLLHDYIIDLTRMPWSILCTCHAMINLMHVSCHDQSYAHVMPWSICCMCHASGYHLIVGAMEWFGGCMDVHAYRKNDCSYLSYSGLSLVESWIDLLEATVDKEAPVELAVFMRAGLANIPPEVCNKFELAVPETSKWNHPLVDWSCLFFYLRKETTSLLWPCTYVNPTPTLLP